MAAPAIALELVLKIGEGDDEGADPVEVATAPESSLLVVIEVQVVTIDVVAVVLFVEEAKVVLEITWPDAVEPVNLVVVGEEALAFEEVPETVDASVGWDDMAVQKMRRHVECECPERWDPHVTPPARGKG